MRDKDLKSRLRELGIDEKEIDNRIITKVCYIILSTFGTLVTIFGIYYVYLVFKYLVF